MNWDVNVWAVLVASVVYFIIGAVWYGMFFGRQWMAALGKSAEEISQGGGAVTYLWTFLLEVVATVTLAVLLLNLPVTGLLGGSVFGGLVGIGLWGTLLAVTFLYEGRQMSLYLIDMGYHVVAFVIAGAILGSWI